jgi:predicted MFS family arabinose efflux permease
LGVICWVLAHRYLPGDAREAAKRPERFDALGTLQLAIALCAYALAMTSGRGDSGGVRAGLLLVALLAALLFVRGQTRAAAPLIRFGMLREGVLRTGLVTSAVVSTVMMATLVVGPFYLARTLRLGTDAVGLTMSVGPVMAALTAAPAGRLVARWGVQRLTLVGLAGIATGSLVLSALPASLGVPGYLAPIVIITGSYAAFQTANNTAVMASASAAERGIVSGMLNLSRNLGLITGASLMGYVFALASASSNLTEAAPAAVATGMRTTFAVAGMLVLVTLLTALLAEARRRRRATRSHERHAHATR